jgi:WD40 repeat protein
MPKWQYRRYIGFVILVVVFASFEVSVAQSTQPTVISFDKALELGRGQIFGMAWHPDGKVLAVSGPNGVWLYSDTLQDLRKLGDDFSAQIAWSPDGKRLAVRNVDPAQLRVWNAENVALISTWTLNQHQVDWLAWSPDGRRLAALGYQFVGGLL